ncbi:MAG: oxygen-independent coproporphyrinogen III oxidase [Proteobacteria bacterium]|nr:oxygen-independent coproporphyrinogen III oxidase [Pseudomonadota bacterium]
MTSQSYQIPSWLSGRLPRYTSYPTAPQFTDMEPETFAGWLGDMKKSTPLSLYIHVPFCAKMCWFCGCNTIITSKYERIRAFTDILLKEIELVGDLLGKDHPVEHLHFGGGSPTILNPEDFARVMQMLKARFRVAEAREIAIEMDPRTLTEETVAGYALAGVNRASLGVQDFDPRVQKAVNREQSLELIETTIGWLKNAGIRDINFDLIYGLPLQTMASLEDTIRKTIALEPARVALFSYAHVPGMKKHQAMIKDEELPSNEMRAWMPLRAAELFEEAGYLSVGMDHFVHPEDSLAQALADGTIRRNFQGYTTDHAAALVAFGPSSISHLPQGYAQNTRGLKPWREAVSAGHLATVRGHKLSDDDRLFGEVIQNIMCRMKVDLADVAAHFGQDTDRFDESVARLKPLEAEGVIECKGAKIEVKTDQRQIVRAISACFDQYLDHRNDNGGGNRNGNAREKYSRVL